MDAAGVTRCDSVTLGLEWTHEPGAGAKPSGNALMLRTHVRW